MARISMTIETALPPDKVLEALLDFSDRRPDIWRGLAREFYEVYSVGEKEADVREGSSKPMKVWAKEHYDWAEPGVVSWRVQESNFCQPGSGVVVRVTPGASVGSTVRIDWERTPSNARGRFIIAFMKLTGGRLISSYTKKTLDGLAKQGA